MPSGDQVGDISRPASRVSRSSPEPSAAAIQMSASAAAVARVNATRCAPGARLAASGVAGPGGQPWQPRVLKVVVEPVGGSAGSLP